MGDIVPFPRDGGIERKPDRHLEEMRCGFCFYKKTLINFFDLSIYALSLIPQTHDEKCEPET